jgi:FkbM family methyltransferase
MKKAIRSFITGLKKVFLGYGQVNKGGDGVINLIDVGSLGNLPSPWFKNARYISHLLKFEPQDKRELTEDIITMDCALWESEKELPFYIYKGYGGSGSSLFKQNFEYVDANWETLKIQGSPKLAKTWHKRSTLERETTLKCLTLDKVLSMLKVEYQWDFMKIDAQGAEYQILRGGERFLNEQCLGLQLELFTKPLYKGIKLKDEVVEYLSQFGFELVKELPMRSSFDAASDCIFLKKEVDSRRQYKMDMIKKVFKIN